MKLQVGDVISSWRFRGWYKIVEEVFVNGT